MDTIDSNRVVLDKLKQFDGFKELRIDGNDLVFNSQKVDISKFSIYDLLDGSSVFSSALADLTSQEIFDIIRIHAIKINSTTPLKKDEEEKKLETIKKENPLMRNLTFVSRTNNGYTDKYLNVVDSMGKDHLYNVDRDINVFGLYDELKIAYGKDNITPEEYIAILDRKLPSVDLESARDFEERSDISEGFQNKIDNLNNRYMGDSRVNILGNEQHDITVVADERGNHQIVTYNTNLDGDLVATSHDQNISAEDTVTYENSVSIDSESNNNIIDSSTEGLVQDMDSKDSQIDLIPFEEFKELINSSAPWDKQQEDSVELYYGYFGDLIRYEDYLLPELQQLLAQFRYFVFELESIQSEGNRLNEHQEKTVEKLRELEEKKDLVKNDDYTKVMNDVQKLVLKMPTNNRDSGHLSVGTALIIIIAITLILTILTILFII